MRSLTNSLRGFLGRPNDERAIAVRALLAIRGVKRRLPQDGYQATLSWLSHRTGKPVDTADARRLAMAAEAAMKRWPVNVTCLERSLVVWRLLGGEPAALIRFGVAPAEGLPKFHAWVEFNGVVANDVFDVAERYAPFVAVVSPTRFD